MKLEEAIHQPAFKNECQKATINTIYTAAWLSQQSLHSLKPFGVSVQQFNILRILRGRKGEPATIKLLTERMLDKMSNASRLVDRLETKGFVERTECKEDRRRVDIFLTASGLELINEVSYIHDQYMQQLCSHLDDADAQQLNELLDKLRQKA
ncbi:MAG: MarR family transcriptional regulator [Saprospiraceae bacterium]